MCHQRNTCLLARFGFVPSIGFVLSVGSEKILAVFEKMLSLEWIKRSLHTCINDIIVNGNGLDVATVGAFAQLWAINEDSTDAQWRRNLSTAYMTKREWRVNMEM